MNLVRGSDKMYSFQINYSTMADPAKPVLDQPGVVPAEPNQDEEEAPAESSCVVTSVHSWEMTNPTSSYLADPHLLEQSMNSFASNVAQVSLCHSSYAFWQVVDFWCL